VIAMRTMTDDFRLFPDAYGWEVFQKEAIELASGQRSDRPRLAIEAILEAADGFAACTVTNATLARRIGCKPDAVSSVLSTLERLGLIRCIRDPRIHAGRWIVLAHHFSAWAVMTELAQSRRVVGRNEDLEPWSGESGSEPGPEPDLELEQEGVIPFARGLGRLLRMRELETDHPAPLPDYGSSF
jgi:hypothetical protein